MKDWKELVKKVAPTLGAALGGPMGGVATQFIVDKFLGGSTDIDAAMATLTPDKLAELKKLDQEFAAQMKKLDVDVFALEVQDVGNARDLAKTDMRPHVALSALFIGGYFIILWAIITGRIEIMEGVKDMVLLLVGILTREVPTIMQFWFGSSFGSKKKDERL